MTRREELLALAERFERAAQANPSRTYPHSTTPITVGMNEPMARLTAAALRAMAEEARNE